MTAPRRGSRPAPADLAAAREQTIPDVIAPGLRVWFSGINPGRSRPPPGTISPGRAEILAIDSWLALEGLTEHYGDATAMSELHDALSW